MNVVPIGAQPPDPEPLPSFDDFWLMYPRRVARKDAARAWDRLTAAEQVAALTGLVGWRREWIRRDEMQYVPHPATWLNGARWEDELPVAATSSHASHQPAVSTPLPARAAMPDSVREVLRRLRGAK
jgi:hypothetical protein